MRHAEEIVWAGGEHPFRLGIGELRALEQKCDAGCSVVMMRLLAGGWKIDDVVATLRVGLVGGGMTEKEAQATVEKAFDVASSYTLAVVAADILRRFLLWDGEDQPGEAEAGEAKADPR
jgi:hypothetical protein